MKKLNWLDYVIIFVLIVAVIGGGWFLKRRANPETQAEKKTKIQFDILITKESLEVCQSYKVGSLLVFGTTNVDDGIITNVEIMDNYRVEEDIEDGRFVLVKAIDSYDAIVTVEFEGVETEDIIRGKQEQICVGKEIIFHGRGFAGKGYISGIEISE